MLHTVFKVAKMTAPSVIYIDEVEKVFCTDKKLSKTWGLRESAGRIKKDLLKEVKALKPGDRVVVIGNAREPWTCAKKDHKAFCGFFDKIFVSPAPEYGARRAVWTALIARRGNGSTTPPDFAMSTLAHLSEGHTPGTMDAVVREVLTEKRIEEANRLPFAAAKPLTADEFFDRAGGARARGGRGGVGSVEGLGGGAPGARRAHPGAGAGAGREEEVSGARAGDDRR
jgi:SpoVK/Ycf46/Vps4 family AAA+-type ATPase